MPAKLEDVRQILAQSRADLMARPNVVATGVGYKFTAGKQTMNWPLSVQWTANKPNRA